MSYFTMPFITPLHARHVVDSSSPLKVVLMGDSLTAQNIGTNRFEASGYFTNLQAMLGQRFIFDENFNKGVGSDQSSDLIARLSDLDGLDADILVLMIGTNDIGVSPRVTYPSTLDIMTNINAIIHYAQTVAGISKIVLGTIPPSNNQNPDQNIARTGLNDAIRARANGEDIILWDYYGDIADGVFWRDGYTHDGVHSNMIGAASMAQKLYEIFDNLYGYGGFYLSNDNVLSNATMSGNLGSVSSSIFTGDLADGWDDSGLGGSHLDAILSKDSDDKQIVSFDSDVEGTFSRRIYQRYSDNNLDEKQVYFEAEIEVLSENTGNGTWYSLSVETRTNHGELAIGFDRQSSNDHVADTIFKQFTNDTGRRLVLRTPVREIPIGTTYVDGRINLQFKNDVGEQCNGAIKVHNAQLVVLPAASE